MELRTHCTFSLLVLLGRKIVRNYLKTWFIIDLVVIGPEWFTSFSSDAVMASELFVFCFSSQFGLDGVGIGRILRLGRAMRPILGPDAECNDVLSLLSYIILSYILYYYLILYYLILYLIILSYILSYFILYSL